MKQCKGVGKFIKDSEGDLIQASAREISFSLYRLLTGEHLFIILFCYI